MSHPSSGHGIIYIEMKADRALEHLNTFNRECDRFLGDGPHAFVGKDDLENRKYIHRIEFKAFPPALGTSLGEFIYSARTGLDQLAWQLALLKKPNPGRDVYFPCVAKNNAQDIERALKPFTKPVREMLDALQPYHAGKAFQDHPLWRLNKLSNLDKHQTIPINSTGVEVFIPAVDRSEVAVFDFGDAIEYHVPIAFKEEMQLQPITASQITLGDWGSDLQISRAALTEIYEFIRQKVIPVFTDSFANVKDPRIPSSRVAIVRRGR